MPSYRLDAETVTATDRCRRVRIHSGLAREFAGAATLPLAACPGVRVDGGDLVWRRVDGDRQDVRVAYGGPTSRSS